MDFGMSIEMSSCREGPVASPMRTGVCPPRRPLERVEDRDWSLCFDSGMLVPHRPRLRLFIGAVQDGDDITRRRSYKKRRHPADDEQRDRSSRAIARWLPRYRTDNPLVNKGSSLSDSEHCSNPFAPRQQTRGQGQRMGRRSEKSKLSAVTACHRIQTWAWM
ncbi:hypothetical protein CALVIDRAFT_192545 [Calocera viscosa TUFC12733]|uniref:Uncharacterized protein n=1 Tax=Calocera viscosa (strain TUFC12733) TaxID=1330018 RepID=A0A167KPI2_CALVF|nr:hypothetical protein CALVIDRAFT_192545 [Calocera viscosa TUFC12733]